MKVSQWQRKNCSYQLWFISVTRLNTALWKSVSLPAGDFRQISSLDGALVTYDLHTPSNIFRSTSVLWWLIPSFCLHLPEVFFYICSRLKYTQGNTGLLINQRMWTNSISWTSKHTTQPVFDLFWHPDVAQIISCLTRKIKSDIQKSF